MSVKARRGLKDNRPNSREIVPELDALAEEINYIIQRNYNAAYLRGLLNRALAFESVLRG